MKTLATMLADLMRADAVPMSDGWGQLYHGEVSGCDCGSRDFTPMLALLVEINS